MRTINLNLFKFDELAPKAKEKALIHQAEFEVETYNPASMEGTAVHAAVEEAEKLKTPWFTTQILLDKYKEDLAEIIRVNEYEFTEDGNFYTEKV